MKRLRISTCVLPVFLAALLVSSGSAFRSAQKATPNKSLDKTKTIYVGDFELDAQNVQPDEGPGGRSGMLRGNGPVRRATGHGTGDPAQQAQHIVNLMADSLVSDFQKAGYIAQRTAPASESIGAGYLVKGVFTEVDEGRRGSDPPPPHECGGSPGKAKAPAPRKPAGRKQRVGGQRYRLQNPEAFPPKLHLLPRGRFQLR